MSPPCIRTGGLKKKLIPLWNYNSITMIQQHLIIMRYCLLSESGDSVKPDPPQRVSGTSSMGFFRLIGGPFNLDWPRGLVWVLQSRFLGRGDKNMAELLGAVGMMRHKNKCLLRFDGGLYPQSPGQQLPFILDIELWTRPLRTSKIKTERVNGKNVNLL